MKSRPSKKLKIFLSQTFFGLIIFILWIRFVNIEMIFFYFNKINLFYLFLAFSLGVLATFLRTLRWKVVLTPIKIVSFNTLVLIDFAGNFLNYVVPIRAGEFAKVWFLKKYYGSSMAKFLSSLLVAKIFDFLTMIFVILVLPLLFFSLDSKKIATAWLPILLFLGSFLVLYLLAWQKNFCLRIFNFLAGYFFPKRFRGKIWQIGNNFIEGFIVIKRKTPVIFLLFIISLLALILDGFYFYFLFLTLGYKFPFILVWFCAILFAFSYLIPSAPGYIGTTEVVGSVVFTLILDLEKNQAASIVVFYHLFNTIIILTLGFLSLEILHFNFFGIVKHALRIK